MPGRVARPRTDPGDEPESGVDQRTHAVKLISDYYLTKSFLRPDPWRVLVYEDFLDSPSPKRILNKLGLPTAGFDETQVRFPRKQNEGDKLRLFADPESVVGSYKSSALNLGHEV